MSTTPAAELDPTRSPEWNAAKLANVAYSDAAAAHRAALAHTDRARTRAEAETTITTVNAYVAALKAEQTAADHLLQAERHADQMQTLYNRSQGF